MVTQQKCYAANSTEMLVRGKCEVKLTVGSVSKNFKFLVVEGFKGAIVGTDWMDQWKILLDIPQQQMIIKPDIVVPFRMYNKYKLRQSIVGTIKTKQRTIVPPHSISLAPIVIKTEKEGLGWIETPRQLAWKRGVFIAPGIIHSTLQP